MVVGKGFHNTFSEDHRPAAGGHQEFVTAENAAVLAVVTHGQLVSVLAVAAQAQN